MTKAHTIVTTDEKKERVRNLMRRTVIKTIKIAVADRVPYRRAKLATITRNITANAETTAATTTRKDAASFATKITTMQRTAKNCKPSDDLRNGCHLRTKIATTMDKTIVTTMVIGHTSRMRLTRYMNPTTAKKS